MNYLFTISEVLVRSFNHVLSTYKIGATHSLLRFAQIAISDDHRVEGVRENKCAGYRDFRAADFT